MRFLWIKMQLTSPLFTRKNLVKLCLLALEFGPKQQNRPRSLTFFKIEIALTAKRIRIWALWSYNCSKGLEGILIKKNFTNILLFKIYLNLSFSPAVGDYFAILGT